MSEIRLDAVKQARELVTQWAGQAETMRICGWDDEVLLDELSNQVAAVLSALMVERDVQKGFDSAAERCLIARAEQAEAQVVILDALCELLVKTLLEIKREIVL